MPEKRDGHLYELLKVSESVGRELTNQFYARYADIRQKVLLRLCRANATVGPAEILRGTQKLLDRVLFCAFCEDRGLLPAETLKQAFTHHDPYNPKPIWENFRGLFRAVDTGNAASTSPRSTAACSPPIPAWTPSPCPTRSARISRDTGGQITGLPAKWRRRTRTPKSAR